MFAGPGPDSRLSGFLIKPYCLHFHQGMGLNAIRKNIIFVAGRPAARQAMAIPVQLTAIMKKAALIILIIATSFCCGFAFNTILTEQPKTTKMKKVTGIGGIFFKCKDPKKMSAWYREHLGIEANDYGASFEWYEEPD